jgi:hypothetical protein
VVLQRFSSEDWGHHDAFKQSSDGASFELSLHGLGDELIPIAFPMSAELPLCLNGRATMVTKAASIAPNPFDAKRNLFLEDLVVKIYHADVTQPSEMDILGEVYKRSNKWKPSTQLVLGGTDHLSVNPIRGHVPILVASGTWEMPFAETFRGYLSCFRRMSRRLVVMIFPRLRLLRELSGFPLWSAFLDCFKCKIFEHLVHLADLELRSLCTVGSRHSSSGYQHQQPHVLRV